MVVRSAERIADVLSSIHALHAKYISGSSHSNLPVCDTRKYLRLSQILTFKEDKLLINIDNIVLHFVLYLPGHRSWWVLLQIIYFNVYLKSFYKIVSYFVFSFILLDNIITHLSHVYYTSVTYLSYDYHTFITEISPIHRTSITHISHTSMTYLSKIYHIYTTYRSHI